MGWYMTGQDPQGICCYCNPFPQCGHFCETTDEFECIQQGGTWLGEGQLDCNDCDEVCANCEQTCTDNSQCPDGYICEFGQCVVDPDASGWGDDNVMPCNRPGISGSKNCQKVLHVKRPYFPNGTPNYNAWGVAVWHPPCDEDCDGSIQDDGEVDTDGNWIIKQEDLGPITFELGTDIYDGDGDPIGKYESGCCCELYLIVAQCWGGVECIGLNNICKSEIPEWNPQIGEVLILRGKDGTPAEGWCGYTLYNFNEDGSQRYGPCNKPFYEWVLNNGCKLGGGKSGSGGCAESVSPGPLFCDLDIEVFQVPDPSWVYGGGKRLCRYACDSCYGIFEQCGACDCHPEYPQCRCIKSVDCDTDRTAMKLNFSADEQDLCGPTHPSGECLFMNEEITSRQYALNDFYWNLPTCITNNTTPVDGGTPCQDCEVLLLQREASVCWCGDLPPGVTCDFPEYAYTWATNDLWNSRRYLKLYVQNSTGSHSPGCYKVVGVIEARLLPSDAVWHTFWISGECHKFPDGHVECHPTNDDVLADCVFCTGDCYGENPILNGRFDCMSFCPQVECEAPCGTAGHQCWGCCITDSDGSPNCCEYPPPPPNGSPPEPPPRQKQMGDWDSIFLFPTNIETEIDIDINNVKTSVPISFSDALQIPMIDSPTAQDVETYNRLSPFQYAPNYLKESLNKTVRTGAVADKRAKVPQVDEANYLGNYSEGSLEWSMWLHIGNCIAVNSEQDMTRKCSFDYTVFAYCQSKKCKVDSKVLENKVVQFNLDTNYFGASDET